MRQKDAPYQNMIRALEEIGNAILQGVQDSPEFQDQWFREPDRLAKEIHRDSLSLIYRYLFFRYVKSRGDLNSIQWTKVSINSLLKGDRLPSVFQNGLFRRERDGFLERMESQETLLSHVGEWFPDSTVDIDFLGASYEKIQEYTPHIHAADLIDPSSKESERSHLSYQLVPLHKQSKRKRRGSFYTPQPLIQFVVKNTLDPLVQGENRQGCKKKVPLTASEILRLRILDPAAGTGHFLLEAARFLAEAYRNALHDSQDIPFSHYLQKIVSHCILGVDIDPFTADLAQASFSLLCMEKPISFSALKRNIQCCDALFSLPEGFPRRFDAVIGNPPWLFLSGKSSPIARLRALGKDIEADELESVFKRIRSRFSNSSQGCQDYYKWFIDLSIQLCKPNGLVGMVVPNTWMTLPRYEDIRRMVIERGISQIVDLGFGVFPDPAVPVSILISNPQSSEIRCAHLYDWNLNGSNTKTLDEECKKRSVSITSTDGEFNFSKHPIAFQIYSAPEFVKAGTLIQAAEGEHSLQFKRTDVIKEERPSHLPIILDWTLGRFRAPELGYVPERYCKTYNPILHTGPRLFLRKTGDQLISAVYPIEALAIAHQNVYVIIPRHPELSIWTLQALLGSKLLTFLYRKGSLGQEGRMLAQLRIAGLYQLPFPPLSTIQAYQNPLILLSQSLHQKRDIVIWERLNELVYAMYGVVGKDLEEIERECGKVGI